LDQYQKVLDLWQSYSVESPADLDKYLDSFRILFAYHSGRIENDEITYNDTREIFENGKIINYTGSPRALFEQQNQKLCYEFLKDKIVSREPLSAELVKEVHKTLTMGTYDERRYVENEERPGEYKKHDYVTGIHEVGSAAGDVESDMAALIDEVNGYGGGEILKAAAYLHVRFEYIHPFADGNGRAGRTLLNYCLMISGHPPLIVYDEDKGGYYDALREYDESENIDALIGFLRGQCEKTWSKTLELSEGRSPERKGLSDFIQG
jgi:Fic family protein